MVLPTNHPDTKTGLYCGEPGKEGCQACLIENGSKTGESCSITALRKKSATILEQAEQVIAPSHDTAQRLRRYFDIPVNVIPWEIIRNVENISFSLPSSRPKRTIGILGAISVEKGFYQILALARFIAQNTLPIEFVLIGYSCDDNALLETGVVKITGHYKEFEIKAFVTACTIDWFFLPSIWPETWSYVLTQIWMTDKPAIVYDIGAPAERIRHAGGGINVRCTCHIPDLRRFFMIRENFRRSQATITARQHFSHYLSRKKVLQERSLLGVYHSKRPRLLVSLTGFQPKRCCIRQTHIGWQVHGSA